MSPSSRCAKHRAIGPIRRWPCSSSAPRSPSPAPTAPPIRSRCSAGASSCSRCRLGRRDGSRRRTIPSRHATRFPLARRLPRRQRTPPVGEQPRSCRRVVGAPAAVSGDDRRRSGVACCSRARACSAADPGPHRRPPARLRLAERLASPPKLMAGPANKRSARGAGTPRTAVRTALPSAPSRRTSALRRTAGSPRRPDLGRQAMSDGVDILDVAGIHMEARRGLFPGIGSQFADIDAFLRASLSAFQSLARSWRSPSGSPMPTVGASKRCARCATSLSSSPGRRRRRAVAAVMLRTSDGAVGRAGRHGRAVPEPEGEVATAGPICWRRCHLATPVGCVRSMPPHMPSTVCSKPMRRSNCRRRPRFARRSVTVQPMRCGADTLVAYPIVWRDAVRGALIMTATGEGAFDRVDRELLDAVVVMGVPALGTGRSLRRRPRDRSQVAARDAVDRRPATCPSCAGRPTTRRQRPASSVVTGTT